MKIIDFLNVPFLANEFSYEFLVKTQSSGQQEEKHGSLIQGVDLCVLRNRLREEFRANSARNWNRELTQVLKKKISIVFMGETMDGWQSQRRISLGLRNQALKFVKRFIGKYFEESSAY